MRRLLLLLLVPLGIGALAGCDGSQVPAPSTEAAGASPTVDTGGAASGMEDEVRLTLYFRAGEGAYAHLERVTRLVAVDDDLPRRAIELLISGPAADEPGLDPTLPASTLVQELEVSGGTARVVLSADVVRDAAAVGDSPANEALALAAITNTLTEFPSVERVHLEVEGIELARGEFWGGWGLPTVLVRDEHFVGTPASGEGVPELGRFSVEPQTTGSSDTGGVFLSTVRVRDRLTHVRVIVELTSASEPGVTNVKVPRARARGGNDEIVVDLSGVEGISTDLAAHLDLQLSDPAFHGVRVEHGERMTTVRLAVDGGRERGFWLHSLTGPTRIVLDVKK